MIQSTIQIAIVVSQFNEFVTGPLLDNCLQGLNKHGIPDQRIFVSKVPGAIEIPLIAKLLAKSKQYHAIITLGAVIRSETNHYDYVCEQVSAGSMQVMLEHEIPVIFGVLTTENKEQAVARINRGQDFADTALTMIHLQHQLSARETFDKVALPR